MSVPVVPSLDAIAERPDLAVTLPRDVARMLTLRALTVLVACATASAPETERPAVAEPDRVVGIDEAASLLAMTKDFLYRNWSTLAVGYKDGDGHVKFPISKLQRYIRARAGR